MTAVAHQVTPFLTSFGVMARAHAKCPPPRSMARRSGFCVEHAHAVCCYNNNGEKIEYYRLNCRIRAYIPK